MGLCLNDTKLTCHREDGKNLVDIWSKKNPQGKVVTNYTELMAIDTTKTSKIMGIFGPDHLPFHALKSPEVPSLANMTYKAIQLLKKNPKGFLLMVGF